MIKKGCDFEMMCVIVHHGLGSKVLRFAKAEGIFGGTIFYGQGTVKNFWLELFELARSQKELVMMAAEKGIAYRFLDILNRELQLDKPNHGIAFSVPIHHFTGGKHGYDVDYDYERVGGDEQKMYQAIYVIVKKGEAERAVEAAQAAGAKGGTIINARGAGRHETTRVFLMDIEPEKEILLILSEGSSTDAIVEAVSREMELSVPGNGVIFVQDISRTYGLYQGK